jgi:hypothetical protein
MLPIRSSPIYLRCNRSTGRSPAAAPIPASPYRWAAGLDEDSAFRYDNDSRWGYFYSGRSPKGDVLALVIETVVAAIAREVLDHRVHDLDSGGPRLSAGVPDSAA